MFDALVARENMRAVFLEYAWDMSWCDPCAADPLSFEELRELGVFWILEQIEGPDLMPQPRGTLHARGLRHPPPSALRRRELPGRPALSRDRGSQQLPGALRAAPSLARRAALRGGARYLGGLPQRFEQEAQNLARLTRWPIEQIRAKMEAGGQSFTPST